jgi:glycolate oxidase iron-sulfur subunit
MKEYAHLLRDDSHYAERARAFVERTRDISELLVELGPVAPRHPLNVSIAYHDACHLAHAQGIRSQPRELLRGIPGLAVTEIAEAHLCCGSAGIYNLLQPEPATELGDRKARNLLATGASVLVTGNPGCSMQIAASARRLGQPLTVAHLASVLDASIRGVPLRSANGAPA